MSAYRLVSTDFSVSDIERFTALSIRRGSSLASVERHDPADLRVICGAVLLGAPAGVVAEDELLGAAERFLAEEGGWLSADAQQLRRALLDSGLLEQAPEGYRSMLQPRPGITRSRLLDELESAQAILAERRARSREALQARNRAVNAPPAPVADPEADRTFMREALAQARAAACAGEVPVGAVLVKEGIVVASAGNRTIRDQDPTAHAEVLVMREAAKRLGNHRLIGTTLYVTLEPCPMCAGAIAEARCERIVFGASDPRRGAVGGALSLFEVPGVNHRPHVASGVLAGEASALLEKFFRERRGSRA